MLPQQKSSYDKLGYLDCEQSTTLSRREVLAFIGIVTAALALPVKQSSIHEQSQSPAGLAERIAKLLGFDHSLRNADASISREVSNLLSELLQRDSARSETIQMSNTQLKALIMEHVAADYSRCDIVNVDGWWISRTEERCVQLIAAMRSA